MEVAGREVRTRARTKAFRVITGILLLAVIAGPLLAALWPEGNGDLPTANVGVTSAASPQFLQILEQSAAGSYDLEITNVPDLDAAIDAGDIDTGIDFPSTLVWDNSADPQLENVLAFALRQDATATAAQTVGLNENELRSLFTPLQIEERLVNGSEAGDGVRLAVAYGGLFLSFLAVQVFGQLTLLSIVEEKSTRVIEVLLSHIKPRTLLGGKVLGLTALALVQLLLLVAGLVVSLLLTDAIDIPSSVWRFVPVLVVSAVGGLVIYNTLFALLGSLISRQEDASQIMLPAMIPIMAGFFIGQSAVFGNAESTIAKVLTYIPFTAPMLLPVRVARDAIDTWEIVLSLGLLALGAVLLMRLAGRVYEFTLLRTGSRVGWGELFRLTRGSAVTN